MAFRKAGKAVVRLAASWSYQEPSPHAIPTQARRIFTHTHTHTHTHTSLHPPCCPARPSRACCAGGRAPRWSLKGTLPLPLREGAQIGALTGVRRWIMSVGMSVARTPPPPPRLSARRAGCAWRSTRALFHAAQAHPAEAPQVKGRTRGRSAGRRRRGLFASGLARPSGPGGRAPRLPWLAEWSMGPACQSLAKIWSCCKLRRKLWQRRGGRRADRRRQSPSRGCVRSTHRAASAPPCAPICIQPPCAQWESWSCTAWQDVLSVCDWLASRRRVRGVGGARVAICVCARCWAACAWRGSAPEARTGEEAQLASRTKMYR